jgi:ketosteroid isomerase-like protein
MSGDESARAEIIGTIARINRAWRTGRVEEMVEAFHDDVVVVQPGFGTRVSGREACVGSYAEFAAAARVHAYDESEHAVDVWGDTAVATYRFRIEYEIEGKTYLETGQDLLVFIRTSDGWRVVWRTLAPLAAESRGEE